MKKAALAFAGILILSLALVCAGAQATGASVDITGTWGMVRIEMSGMSMDPADVGLDMRFTLDASGGVLLQLAGQEDLTGTWTFTNGQMALISDQGGEPLLFALSGEELVAEDEGMIMAFAKETDDVQASALAAPSVLTNVSLADFDGVWMASYVEMEGMQIPTEIVEFDMQLTISGGVLDMLSNGELQDGIPCRLDRHELVMADGGIHLTLHEGHMLSWSLEEGGAIWFAFADEAREVSGTTLPAMWEAKAGAYTGPDNRYRFDIPAGWTAIDQAKAQVLLAAGTEGAGVSGDVLEIVEEIPNEWVVMLFESDKLATSIAHRSIINFNVADMGQEFTQSHILSFGDAFTEHLQTVYLGYTTTIPIAAVSFGPWQTATMGGAFMVDGQRIALRQVIYSAGDLLVTATLTADFNEIADYESVLAELVASFTVPGEGPGSAELDESPSLSTPEQLALYQDFLSICEAYDIPLGAGARQASIDPIDDGMVVEYVPIYGVTFSYYYDMDGTMTSISLWIDTGVTAVNQVMSELLISFVTASDPNIEKPAELITSMVQSAEAYTYEGSAIEGMSIATVDAGGDYSYTMLLIPDDNLIGVYLYPKN